MNLFQNLFNFFNRPRMRKTVWRHLVQSSSNTFRDDITRYIEYSFIKLSLDTTSLQITPIYALRDAIYYPYRRIPTPKNVPTKQQKQSVLKELLK